MLAKPWTGLHFVLIRKTPTGVTPGRKISPPGNVAVVGIVIAGKKVTEFVKNQFLRIAKSRNDFLQTLPIGPAAENGT